MRAEVRILVGLAMIGAGGAGLLAMNLWTLPTIVPAPCPEPPRCLPAVAQLPPPSSTPAPVVRAAPSASEAVAADASPDGPEEGSSDTGGETSKSTDGTIFPAIRFEERSRAPSRDLMTAIQPLAAYLRGHFEMKVVLTGHGDAAMSAAEYVQTGRMRAGTVLRMLVDYGVSVSRITIEAPAVEGDQVESRGVAPGTVEASVEPRFETRKGDADVP